MRRRPRPRRARLTLSGAVLLLLAAAAFWLLQEAGLWGTPPAGGRPSSAAPAPVSSRPVSQESAPGLEVYFLDVGQGDSALIRHTGGEGAWTMLIDTGEYAYADGLTDYLRDLGVERIDALVCTHPHTDHMGCMARIVQRFDVGGFYMPQVPEEMVPTTSAYEALLDALSAKEGLTVSALHSSTAIACPEGLEIQALAPRSDAEWEGLNNWSGVLRLAYGDTSFLFTGDAEKQSEWDILEDAEERGWELNSTVLKCGHHGSSTSTSAKFLKAVAPQYAVISCGRENEYGHPHKETLKKLDLAKIPVYRTDQDGTVLARSDGKTVSWETGLPSVKAREWD